MAITDRHVRALRALLGRDPEYEQLTRQLAEDEEEDGYGQLALAAFTRAVRRRFGRQWQPADVIGYVAALRARLLRSETELEPRITEDLIRQALEARPAPQRGSTAIAEALLLVLTDLAPGPDGLDVFLHQARAEASAMSGQEPR